MLTVRVFLEPCSPTSRPHGLYDTFVALTPADFAWGEHLRLASRRAMILGYGGPLRVSQVRVITPVITPPTAQPDDERAMSDSSVLRERLEVTIEAASAHAMAAAPVEPRWDRSDPRQLVRRRPRAGVAG